MCDSEGLRAPGEMNPNSGKSRYELARSVPIHPERGGLVSGVKSDSSVAISELNEERKQLSFTEIVQRTGMEQTACFRLLRTLEHEGFLRRSGRHKYTSNLRILLAFQVLASVPRRLRCFAGSLFAVCKTEVSQWCSIGERAVLLISIIDADVAASSTPVAAQIFCADEEDGSTPLAFPLR